MKNSLDFSIITPSHNEEEILEQFVQKAASYITEKKLTGEIIVVENGSSDNTLELAKGLQRKFKNLTVLSLPTGNKGKALRKGILEAKGEKLVTLDTDLWDAKFVDQSLNLLDTSDIVIGSKGAIGANDQRSFAHKTLTNIYNFIFRLTFNLKASDTKARLAFNKSKIEKIVEDCKTDDLLFDTELLIRSERKGLKIVEVPSTVEEIRGPRYSISKRWKNIVAEFFTLLRFLGPSPSRAYILLFSSLLIGAFLRYYKYKEWFFFEVDEEHYAFMARMITVNHHFPLIGGPISGTKLYMAPWFLYFSSIWLFISQNSVLFFGVVTIFIGLATILFVYLIGKRIHSPTAGALASLLYATSFQMVLFDRHQWNVTLLPLVSVSAMYFLIRWIEDKKIQWLVIASAVVSFGISSTFTAFAVLLFAFFTTLFFGRKKIFTNLGVFIGVIALSHFTLLLFDLRHNFWLTRAFWEFLTHPAYESLPIWMRLVNTLYLFSESIGKALIIFNPLDIADESSICLSGVMRFVSPVWTQLVGLGFIFAYLFLLLRKKLSRFGVLPVLLLIVNILALILFRADPSERHWLPFYPLFFIMIATSGVYVFNKNILAKIIVALAVLLLVGINCWAFLTSWSTYGYSDKEAAVKYIIASTTPGKVFVDAVGQCHKWGYRYQFSINQFEPAGSYIDPDFNWMYNVAPTPQNATVKATIFSPNKNIPEPDSIFSQRKKLTQNSYEHKKFGNVEVFLEKVSVSQ